MLHKSLTPSRLFEIKLSQIFLVILLIQGLAISMANAEFHLTVIQTSDLHSHFTNRESMLGLGGLARVATKINELRNKTENTLLLDAGDFTEGTIFFTLGSGETTDHLMEALGYDAIALGNHDWLIGPDELTKTLNRSRFRIPILSANLDISEFKDAATLAKFVKPYLVRDFHGVKVGVFGLSTYQFIFDSFFKPVKLLEPVEVAKSMIKKLREDEGCQVVIALSHLGIDQDKKVADAVEGLDLIVGGHSHILLQKPEVVNNTPITHVGKWGQYVGQIDLEYNQGQTKLVNYKLHPIDQNVQENPILAEMITGAIAGLKLKFGEHLFDDLIVRSDVDLPIQDIYGESAAGNWAADAIREAAHADVVFENPTYSSRDLFRGYSSSGDIFNAFPHIYNPQTEKAWTIKTFRLNGYVANLLVSAYFRTGLSLKVSNANIVLDLSKSIDQVEKFEIGGEDISGFRNYTVAGTDGVIAVFDKLREYGLGSILPDVKETGLEAWRVIKSDLTKRSPITSDKVKWEGRVRTLQPDLEVRGEEFTVRDVKNGVANLEFLVRNTGLTASAPSEVSVNWVDDYIDPNGFYSKKILSSNRLISGISDLEPGQSTSVKVPLELPEMKRGRYLVKISVSPVAGELQTGNNSMITYIDVN